MQGKYLLYDFIPLSSGISICMMSSILVAVVPYVKIANASVCGFDSTASVDDLLFAHSLKLDSS